MLVNLVFIFYQITRVSRLIPGWGYLSLRCPTHAFEIQPAVACRLEMSIKASALDVQVHRNTVRSEAGKTFIFPNLPQNPGGVGLGGEAPEVESVRLDDVFADSGVQIAFIKIDTEGNEFEAGAYTRPLFSSKVSTVRPAD